MNYKTKITEIINEFLIQTQIIDIDTSFKDIGVDSISFVQIIVEIENTFEIEFPHDKMTLSQSGTIKALCETVSELKGEVLKNEKD